MHPIERLRYVARSTGLPAGELAFESADALADLSFDPQALVIAARRLLEAHLDCAPLWWVVAHILASDDPVVTSRLLANELAGDPTAEELAAALPGGAHVVMSPSPVILSASYERPDLTVDIANLVGRDYEVMRALRAVPNSNVVTLEALPTDSDAIAVVPMCAASADGYVVTSGDALFAAQAKNAGIAVWAIAGVGCVLPSPLFAAFAERVTCNNSTTAQSNASDVDEEEIESQSWQKLDRDAIDVIVGPDGPFLPTPQSFRTTCPVPRELCVY